MSGQGQGLGGRGMSDGLSALPARAAAGTGLPAGLLGLLRRHPRDGWQRAAGLAGSGEVWLANHRHFRDLTGRISGGLAALREGRSAPDHFDGLFRHDLGSLLAGLDGHHRIEDHHYFPIFRQAVPTLAPGFEILDADHTALHAAIHDLAFAGQGLLRALGAQAQAGDDRLADAAGRAAEDAAAVLARFGLLLGRHLDDEEDLVIPLILERARADPDFG